MKMSKYHVMESMGSGSVAPSLSISTLDEGERFDSLPDRLTQNKLIAGWVGPSFGLDIVKRRIMLLPCRESIRYYQLSGVFIVWSGKDANSLGIFDNVGVPCRGHRDPSATNGDM
jgi:hypothetical protein